MRDWVSKMGQKARNMVHVPAADKKAHNDAAAKRDDPKSTSSERVAALETVKAWNDVMPSALKK